MNIKELVRTGIFLVGSFLGQNRSSRVIYYHGIHGCVSYTDMSTSLDLFKRHVEVIRKAGFEIVRDIKRSKGEIQIAFDDGFRGLLDCADWLVSQRVYPTVFIPTTLIGKEGYLSESEIMRLHEMGFNIQSHGVRHKNMSALIDEELQDDLCTSKTYFERLLGKTVDSVCYPQGYYSDRVISESLKAGYQKLYISVPGEYDMDKMVKHRSFFQSLSPIQARLALHGGMDILASHYQKLHYNTLHRY